MEESINQNEPVPGEGDTATDQPPAPHRKNKVLHLIKEMWPAYLVEIFVIILGISITLALEEWRDAGKEKHLEKIYLENLRADIELDLQSLKYASNGTQKIIDQGNDLLTHIKNPESNVISHQQLEADIRGILGRPTFVVNDATFSDLKSSGNLHLLTNINLKGILFAYYSQAQRIKEVQDAEQQATIILSGSYFLKQFPMGDFGNQPPYPEPNALNGLSRNIEFNNNILLRVTTRKELLGLYQIADSMATLLKNVLPKSQ